MLLNHKTNIKGYLYCLRQTGREASFCYLGEKALKAAKLDLTGKSALTWTTHYQKWSKYSHWRDRFWFDLLKFKSTPN